MTKHRIVKRYGIWQMYCPQRGTESIIYAPSFSWAMLACRTPCPHLDERYFLPRLLTVR